MVTVDRAVENWSNFHSQRLLAVRRGLENHGRVHLPSVLRLSTFHLPLSRIHECREKARLSTIGLAWPRSLFSWLLGTGRPVLMVLVVVGLLGGGVYLAWRKLKPRILGAPEYRVGPEQVEITPPPGLDPQRRPGGGFPRSFAGWSAVADGRRSDRTDWQGLCVASLGGQGGARRQASSGLDHPASVKVELVYRQPVCMVEVPGGVLAVDAEGVLLPSEDFSPLEAARYPRLVGVEQKPAGPPGRRWGDAKVVGGAEIAAALGPAWEVMRLQRIVPLGRRHGRRRRGKGPDDSARRPGADLRLVHPRRHADPLGLCPGRQHVGRAVGRRESRPAPAIPGRARHARRAARSSPGARRPHAAAISGKP